MPLRMTRGTSSRDCPVDEIRTLGMWPVFAGERIRTIIGNFMLTTDEKEKLTVPAEYNLVMLAIPWTLWVTYGAGASESSPLNWPNDLSSMDERFERLVFDWQQDGSNYYGGDEPGGTSSEGDDNQEDIPRPGGANPSSSSSVDSLLSTNAQVGNFMGPLNITALYTHETLLRPWGAIDTDEGLLMDNFDIRLPVNMGFGNTGGLVIFGVKRYELTGDQSPWLSVNSANQANALARLLGGDVHRINTTIRRDVYGPQTDEIINWLWGGDQMMQGGPLASFDLKAYLKWTVTYDTPYSIYSG